MHCRHPFVNTALEGLAALAVRGSGLPRLFRLDHPREAEEREEERKRGEGGGGGDYKADFLDFRTSI
jgi:hypothetical protein